MPSPITRRLGNLACDQLDLALFWRRIACLPARRRGAAERLLTRFSLNGRAIGNQASGARCRFTDGVRLPATSHYRVAAREPMRSVQTSRFFRFTRPNAVSRRRRLPPRPARTKIEGTFITSSSPAALAQSTRGGQTPEASRRGCLRSGGAHYLAYKPPRGRGRCRRSGLSSILVKRLVASPQSCEIDGIARRGQRTRAAPPGEPDAS